MLTDKVGHSSIDLIRNDTFQHEVALITKLENLGVVQGGFDVRYSQFHLPQSFQDEFASESIGFRLIHNKGHIGKLYHAPSVAYRLQRRLVGPIVRVGRPFGYLAILNDGHAVNAGVQRCIARLQVEQILDFRPRLAYLFKDVAQILLGEVPLAKRLDTIFKSLSFGIVD